MSAGGASTNINAIWINIKFPRVLANIADRIATVADILWETAFGSQPISYRENGETMPHKYLPPSYSFRLRCRITAKPPASMDLDHGWDRLINIHRQKCVQCFRLAGNGAIRNV
jgi:hypothetical protein